MCLFSMMWAPAEVPDNFLQCTGGFQNQICFVEWNADRMPAGCRIAQAERNVRRLRWLKRQLIAKLRAKHDGFQFMKTIRAFAKNFEKDVQVSPDCRE